MFETYTMIFFKKILLKNICWIFVVNIEVTPKERVMFSCDNDDYNVNITLSQNTSTRKVSIIHLLYGCFICNYNFVLFC